MKGTCWVGAANVRREDFRRISRRVKELRRWSIALLAIPDELLLVGGLLVRVGEWMDESFDGLPTDKE